jgi:PAS domain S-box-containing protein
MPGGRRGANHSAVNRRGFMAQTGQGEVVRYFRRWADVVDGPVWAATPDGSCLFVNRWWMARTHLSEASSPTPAWLTALHGDDREPCAAAWAAAVSSRQPFRYHARLLTVDGLTPAYVLQADLLLDDDGQPFGWIGTATTLARATPAGVARQADEGGLTAVTQSAEVARAELEGAIAASQVVLFHQDRDLRYTWIHNPALGYDATVIGRRDAELMERAEDAARTEAIKRLVLETGQARREEVCVVRHGQQRFYDLVVQPALAPDGTMDGVRCAAVDITPRKEAEAALLVAGQSFRQLVEQSPFGICAVDADFRLVMVSAGAQKVFRASAHCWDATSTR